MIRLLLRSSKVRFVVPGVHQRSPNDSTNTLQIGSFSPMIDFFTNFGSLHRPGGHPPHAQRARPRGKTSQTPSEGRQVVSHLGEDGEIIAAKSSDRLYLGVDHRGKLELFCGDIHGKQ